MKSAVKGIRMQDKLQEIETLAASANGGDRCRAVERLAGMSNLKIWKDEPRCFELLNTLAGDPKYEVRQVFAEQSVLLPEDWLWKLLPPLLNDPNPFVRRAAQRVRKQRGQAVGNGETTSTSKRMTLDVLATRIETAMKSDPLSFRQTVVSSLRDAQELKVVEFAHELKNLLHPLSSAVGRLREEMSQNTLKKHAGTLNKISTRAKRLDEFCDAMKFLADGGKLHFDMIKCDKIIDLVMQGVTDLAAEKNVSVQVRDVSDVSIKVVVERLTRAIGNILRNAIEASRPGGQVELLARLLEDSNEVEFVIRDNGKGISSEAKQVIFDPLVSGKKEKEHGEHMGMGLFIAHTVIVQEHNGEIDVDSDGSTWTIFKIRIPL